MRKAPEDHKESRKRLRARLQEAGVWDRRLRREIAALWECGIEPIGDEELRATVAAFLCVVPKIFFTDVASRSGRLHPSWQNVKHGTLRSIIESCVELPGWARHIPQLLDEEMNPLPGVIDLGLAATIISDVWKKEDPDKGDIHYGADHGYVAATHWTPFAHAHGLNPRVVGQVADGSVWHMGIYSPRWWRSMELSPLARLVNLADVATSLPGLDKIYKGKTVIR